MTHDNIINACLLEEPCLGLDEMAQLCAVDPEWVAALVREGYLTEQSGSRSEWRFGLVHMRRLRRMRAVQRDFDAVPELAALVADMLEEMDELRARLARRGL